MIHLTYLTCIPYGSIVILMDHPNSTHQALAALVSEGLAKKKISQREAAARANIAFTTLNRRLSGASPFTTAELVALGDLIGVPASRLLARAEKQVAA